VELRHLKNIEMRAQAGNTIAGYAAVFDSPSNDPGLGFTETIRKGCFARAIRAKQDVRCLFNHDDSRILGRVNSGTLTLREDATGLFYECQVPDSPTGRDVYAAVQRGDISECSFGFKTVLDRWSRDGSQRELLDVDLRDVSPVTFPAYPATSVEARREGECRTYYFVRQSTSSLYTPTVDPTLEDERRLLQARLLEQQIKLH
jgi:hypothetical protein